MALLTRSRRRSDPAAEALDRAREVSTEAFERATDAAEWARDAAEPRIAQVREAAEPRIAKAREAAEPRIAQVREAAEPRIAKAREAAEPRIAEVREASAPALAQARRGLGALLRLLVRLVALLPDIGARVLGTVAVVLGRLADRSAEVANVEPPSRTGRRRRAALWFTGGFAAGAAAGYAVCEATRRDEHVHDDQPWQPRSVPGGDQAGAPSGAARADG